MSSLNDISLVIDINEFIQVCMKYITSPYEDICELVVWSLTHFIRESREVFEVICLKSKFLQELLKLTKNDTSLAFARTYSWFFSVMFKNYPKDIELPFEIIKEIINLSYHLLNSNDDILIMHNVWVFSNISEIITSGYDDLFIKSGIAKRILQVRQSRDVNCPIISFIGNLCTGEEHEVEVY
jgi:hypothetical protein